MHTRDAHYLGYLAVRQPLGPKLKYSTNILLGQLR